MWVALYAEAAVAAAPEAAVVEAVEITARAPVVGDLKEGVQAFRPEFFTPVRPGTAMDMIRWLPGFTFEDVRDVRGLGGAIGNVLIDGQPPTSKTDTLATVLGRIPAGQVERVDIIVGSAPGIDMRGRPVIANVVLKKTSAVTGAVTASVNAYSGGRFGLEVQSNVARKRDDRAFEVGLTARRVIQTGPYVGRGTQVRTDAAGRALFSADAYTRSAVLWFVPNAAYEFPIGDGRLRVNGSYRLIRGHFLEEAEAPGLVSTNLLRDQDRRGEAGLRYTRPLGGGLSLESQFLQRLGDYHNVTTVRRPGIFTDFAGDQKTTESVLRSTLRWKRDETLTLEAAAEGAFNSGDNTSSRLIAGTDTPLPAGDVRVEEWRGDFGANLAWKPQPAYGVTAALRVETSTLQATGDANLDRSLTYLKPRMVLSYAPNPKTQIRLRLEHEVNQISFANFAAVIEYSGVVRAGNPNLRPRRVWVTEAVVERQFWSGASLVATARHSAVRDALDERLVPGFGDSIEIANIGAARIVELIGTVTLPLKRFGWDGVMVKGTVTRAFTQVTDPTTGEERPISVAPWVGELHFSHDLPRWKITWGVDYAHQAAVNLYRPKTVELLPAYPRLSAFVEYRITPKLTLRAEGFNLNDYKGRSRIDYFAAVRPAALDFRDTRTLGDGPYVMLRLRRALS